MIAEYGGEQSKAEDSGDDEAGENDGPAPRRAPIGPAMPSQAMLAQAQEAAKDFVQEVRRTVAMTLGSLSFCDLFNLFRRQPPYEMWYQFRADRSSSFAIAGVRSLLRVGASLSFEF